MKLLANEVRRISLALFLIVPQLLAATTITCHPVADEGHVPPRLPDAVVDFAYGPVAFSADAEGFWEADGLPPGLELGENGVLSGRPEWDFAWEGLKRDFPIEVSITESAGGAGLGKASFVLRVRTSPVVQGNVESVGSEAQTTTEPSSGTTGGIQAVDPVADGGVFVEEVGEAVDDEVLGLVAGEEVGGAVVEGDDVGGGVVGEAVDDEVVVPAALEPVVITPEVEGDPLDVVEGHSNTLCFNQITLPDATHGYSYSPVTFSAKTGERHFFKARNLPPGMDLNRRGVLSGKPIWQDEWTGTSHVVTFRVSIHEMRGGAEICYGEYPITILKTPELQIDTPGLLPDGVMDVRYIRSGERSVRLSASGGTPFSSGNYTWRLAGGKLPTGMGLNSWGVLTGIPILSAKPPVDIETFTFIAEATDAVGFKATKSFTFRVFPPDPPKILTDSSLPDGLELLPYTLVQLKATGGKPTYSWSVDSGALPPGLKLSARGYISGTPLRDDALPKAYEFVLKVVDRNGLSETKQFSITILPAPEILTEEILICARVGLFGYDVVDARGGDSGNYVWSANGLPPDLGITGGPQGIITGTYSQAGVYTPTITVTEPSAGSDSRQYTVEVKEELLITTPSPLTFGVRGRGYPGNGDLAAFSFTASGGWPGYTWQLRSGILPPGLTLDSSGALNGVPTVTGTYNFAVRVLDSCSLEPVDGNFTVTIYEPLKIETASFASCVTAGQDLGSFCLTASGGLPAYSWAIASGTLPAGVAFDPATGCFSGTPEQSGSYAVTVEVTDQNGSTDAVTYDITVYEPLIFTTTCPVPHGVVGEPYDLPLDFAGGKTPPLIVSASGLPDGMSCSSEGVLSGSPTAAGVYGLTVTAVDDCGNTIIEPCEITIYDPLAIDTQIILDCITIGDNVQECLEASGGSGDYTWTIVEGDAVLPGASFTGSADAVSGDLPGDLVLDPVTGCLSGTVNESGEFTVTVQVFDNVTASLVQRTYTFTVDEPLTILTDCPLPVAVNGVEMPPVDLVGQGGRGPYTWFVDWVIFESQQGVVPDIDTATPLDVGDILASDITTLPGTPPILIGGEYGFGIYVDGDQIVGTPYVNGPYPRSVGFILRFVDACGRTQVKACSIQIDSQVEITTEAISACLIEGDPASLVPCFEATGGSTPYAWSDDGNLPPGVTLNATTGCLEGQFNEAGTFSFSVSVTDSYGQTDTKAYTIKVNPPLDITTDNVLPGGVNGEAYSPVLLNAVGGSWVYINWFHPDGDPICGALPQGVQIQGDTAQGFYLVGRINEAGVFPRDFSFCLTVVDDCGKAWTETFTLNVTDPLRCEGGGDPGCSMVGQPITPICFSADGGTGNYSWSASGLPAGLTIDASGCISGTPGQADSFDYVVTVSDGVDTSTIAANIVVAQELSIETSSLGYWTLGQERCVEIDVIGGYPSYSASVTVSPPVSWISDQFTDENTLQVCATPDSAGRFTLSVSIDDRCEKTITRNYTFYVISGGGGGVGCPTCPPIDPEDPILHIETVTVCDEGNEADPETGYGRVDYCYILSRYEITNAQYAFFLNEVARTDTYDLYDERMGSDVHGGIQRYGGSGSFVYLTKSGYADMPVTFVNWFDAARFINWLSNGQPTGLQDVTTTEDGTYPLNGAMSGIITKQAANPNTGQPPLYWIPTEDEWYKAAYYKGGGTAAGYWEYPTSNDTIPGNSPGALANQANFISGNVYSRTQSPTFSSGQNYLWAVGTFSLSPSPYQTFDQGGNVSELNDAVENNFERGFRGGSWKSTLNLHKGARSLGVPNSIGDEFTGFRIAGAAQVQPVPTLQAEMIAVDGGTMPLESALSGTAVDGFEIGKYEVTWGEWQEVRDWAVLNGYADLDGVGEGSAADHPVRNVSWYDVVKWCNAASEKDGLTPVYLVGGVVYRTGQSAPTVDGAAGGYRLPTEAEWEWAARGGVSSQGYIYSGSDDLDEVGWYEANSSGAVVEIVGTTGTWSVGEKAANELGLYDMSGNVSEWCLEENTASGRRMRGGGFFNQSLFCEVTYRHTSGVGTREVHFGFRLARSSGN